MLKPNDAGPPMAHHHRSICYCAMLGMLVAGCAQSFVLRGRILWKDQEEREVPLSSAQAFVPAMKMLSARTDSNGRFELRGRSRPGCYELNVRSLGLRPVITTFLVSRTTSIELSPIVMNDDWGWVVIDTVAGPCRSPGIPSFVLRGRILGKDGNGITVPLDGGEALVPALGLLSPPTDTTGQFEIKGKSWPGCYELQLRRIGFIVAVTTVLITRQDTIVARPVVLNPSYGPFYLDSLPGPCKIAPASGNNSR